MTFQGNWTSSVISDEDFRFTLSQRIKQSIRSRNVNEGLDSKTFLTLGLDKDPKTPGAYVPNRLELNIVENIYDFFQKSGSIKKTLDHCKVKGYRDKDRSGNFVNFNSKRLISLLKSQKIRGWNQFIDDEGQFRSLWGPNKVVKWSYRHGPLLSPALIAKVDSLLQKI